LNSNPLEIRHLLDTLDRSLHAESIAMNILSELNMLDEYQDHENDHIDYTLAWVWYCGQLASEINVDYLAHMIWSQIQHRNDFVCDLDPGWLQSLGHLALRGIRDHSARNDFIERLDSLAERDLNSVQNGDLEQELHLFADAFQAGSLLGETMRPGVTIGQHEANPGIIDRGILRLNAYYTLPQIRGMVVEAFSST